MTSSGKNGLNIRTNASPKFIKPEALVCYDIFKRVQYPKCAFGLYGKLNPTKMVYTS